jgi:DNA-binding CsgD family transcriptional regulator
VVSWANLHPEIREAAERDLSPRQLDVLKLHLAGRSMRQIALALDIAPSTVTSHLWRAKQKLSTREAA